MERTKTGGKTVFCFILILCFVGLVQANSQRIVERRNTAVTNLLESAKRWEGVREITGNNDHPMITKAMKLCGLAGNKGYPWCAACIADIHDKAGIPAPYSAKVVDWFKYNVVWESKNEYLQPEAKPGMVGALYYRELGRYGHIVLIVGSDKNNYYTVEGNTNEWGSREGEGFYKKIRSKKSISALADYCITGKDFIEMYKK